MGYTHYWTGPTNLDPAKFKAFSQDCEKIVIECRSRGIVFADGGGDEGEPEITETNVVFNGLGDEAHETFGIGIERDNGFDFCKTARKSYDLAVTSCLIALKKHFGNEFDVASDGSEEDWAEGRKLCQSVLGYGNELVIFKTEEEEEEEEKY